MLLHHCRVIVVIYSFLFILLRSALEQKQAEEEKEFGAIDYDSPTSSDNKTIGLGTKVKVFLSSTEMLEYLF